MILIMFKLLNMRGNEEMYKKCRKLLKQQNRQLKNELKHFTGSHAL